MYNRDRSPEVDDVKGFAAAHIKHLELLKQKDKAESSFNIFMYLNRSMENVLISINILDLNGYHLKKNELQVTHFVNNNQVNCFVNKLDVTHFVNIILHAFSCCFVIY